MIDLEIEVPDIEYLKKVAAKRAHKKAMETAHTKFVKNRLPKRFRGYVEGFKPRSRKWKKIKTDIKGPTVANQHHLFTGDTKSKSKRGELKVTAKQVSYKITGLNEGYGRRKKPRAPDMKKELESMTASEREAWTKIYEEELIKLINDPKNFKKKRIKSKQ